MNPNPWRESLSTQPNKSASFVEYLRWMRVRTGNKIEDSGTVLEIFQKFENNDYSTSLNRLTERTKKLADEYFEAECSWRIRVGGAKGPESMLLPAFDGLGMPYIPSSTLRGIAREIAAQEKTPEEVKRIFGNIDPESSSMGLVIFLDAYPLAGNNKQGGLKPDMANAIWKWDNDNTPPKYDPNPNNFISLFQPTFIIGLRRTANCNAQTLEKVKIWLIKGLSQGIGSRVNSGYGTLEVPDINLTKCEEIISVIFSLEGQLIHGGQEFTQWQRNKKNTDWKNPGTAIKEVRSVAFRCMLRYWFRVFGLGVLSVQEVRQVEMEIFGGIEPDPMTGLFRLEVVDQKIEQEKPTEDDPSLSSGKLIISCNNQSSVLAQRNQTEYKALKQLLKALIWLMFHLGGVGQGARRPCYFRGYERGRNGCTKLKNPPWRGANLIPDPDGMDKFWNLSPNLTEFKHKFQSHLNNFYTALQHFSGKNIDLQNLNTINTGNNWKEAIDKNCCIVICQGQPIENDNKCFALSMLHGSAFKIGNDYDPILCGRTQPQPPRPSPIWIRNLDYVDGINYQVVTVFGANHEKRQQFLDELKEPNPSNYLQVFPFEEKV